jgi:hypothetical protein
MLTAKALGLVRLERLRTEGGLDSGAVDRALEAFFADVRCIFTAALAQVRAATGSKSAHEANSKFDGFEGSFASLKDFHAGAEATLHLGYPNPDIERGILLEHTAHAASVARLFVTPNYRLATCLLLEYWWAVDPYDRTALDLLVRRKVSRGNADDASKCLYSPLSLLYPGEVGDCLYETAVVFSLSVSGSATLSAPHLAAAKLTDSKLTEKLIESMELPGADAALGSKSAVLASDEERAREVQVVLQRACLEWQAHSAHVLAPSARSLEDATKALEKAHADACTAVVGVVLPVEHARALEQLAGIRAAVAKIVGLPDSVEAAEWGVGVQVLWVSGRTTTYCQVPSVAELQKQLGELTNMDLRSTACDRWGVATATDGTTRAKVVVDTVDAFVQQELQSEFAAALWDGFKTIDSEELDAALDELLQDWSPRPPSPHTSSTPSASREERIAEAVAGLVSAARWEAVARWVELFRVRLQGRMRAGISELMLQKKDKIEQFKLKKGEVLALYLYTGPEFVLMNGILRNFPQRILDLLLGNTMCTTLFCISSALKKIGRGTELPRSGKVYRGLGKMLLPSQFWVQHDTPAWRGGVERAFMSTTADKGVAVFYANGRGTVVEISVGRIQIGGDISFLSMVCT